VLTCGEHRRFLLTDFLNCAPVSCSREVECANDGDDFEYMCARGANIAVHRRGVFSVFDLFSAFVFPWFSGACVLEAPLLIRSLSFVYSEPLTVVFLSLD